MSAASAVFVDRASTDCIADNAKRAHFDQVNVIRADVFRAVGRLNAQQFDLIFADPPYHFGLAQQTVDLVTENNLLSNDGLLVVEYGTDENIISDHLESIRKEIYGHTTIIEILGRKS